MTDEYLTHFEIDELLGGETVVHCVDNLSGWRSRWRLDVGLDHLDDESREEITSSGWEFQSQFTGEDPTYGVFTVVSFIPTEDNERMREIDRLDMRCTETAKKVYNEDMWREGRPEDRSMAGTSSSR